MKCIILAAGMGKRLQPYTLDTPKPLLRVGDKSLLQYKVESLRQQGFQDKDLVVVVGYRQQQIKKDFPGLTFIFNRHYSTRNNLYSLWLARQHTAQGFFLLNADTLHSREIFRKMFASTKESTLAADSAVKSGIDLGILTDKKQRVIHVDFNLSADQVFGKAAQFSKFSPADSKVFMRYVHQSLTRQEFQKGANILPPELCSALHLSAIDIKDLPWAEVDTVDDLNKARRMVQENGNLF